MFNTHFTFCIYSPVIARSPCASWGVNELGRVIALELVFGTSHSSRSMYFCRIFPIVFSYS